MATASDQTAVIDAPAETTPQAPPPKASLPGPAKRPKKQPPYHVILLDDNDHTYEYVIVMLQSVFGFPIEKGFQMACEVDGQGRVILLTTTKEHAELKRDQIHAFGPDPLLSRCKGSMTAVIEPAEE